MYIYIYYLFIYLCHTYLQFDLHAKKYITCKKHGLSEAPSILRLHLGHVSRWPLASILGTS